jgi:hypothetical protein
MVVHPVVAEIPQAAAVDMQPTAEAPLPTPIAPRSTLVVVEPTARPSEPGLRTLLAGAIKDQPGWPSDPSGAAWLDGGSYRLAAMLPTRFVAVAAPLQDAYTDVVVSAAFHKLSGPPGGGYGIIVRDHGPGPRDGVAQGGQFYVAEAGDRGEIGVWRREDDHWVALLPWTPSQAVYPGGTTNELTVRAEGPRLTFLVNGIEATTLSDITQASGRVGAFVAGDYNQVVLERFTVQVPPAEVAP